MKNKFGVTSLILSSVLLMILIYWFKNNFSVSAFSYMENCFSGANCISTGTQGYIKWLFIVLCIFSVLLLIISFIKRETKIYPTLSILILIIISSGVFYYRYFFSANTSKRIEQTQILCVPAGGTYGAPGSSKDLCCAGLVKQPTTQSGTVGICVKPSVVTIQQSDDWKKYSNDQLMAIADMDWNNKAMFFKGREGNFLIIDQGTAPDPRGLIIYDLIAKKQVFYDRYSKPLDITNITVSYWSPTEQVVTEQNCPNYLKWKSGGLGAEIESHIVLDFQTLTKKDLGQIRCQATQ